MSVLGIAAHGDHEALANFIEGMKVSESAAQQMALYTDEPAWLRVRLALEGVRETATRLAQASFAARLRG